MSHSTTPELKRRSVYTFRPKLWATLLTLVIVALFIQLSIWQFHRYEYKKNLQAAYAAQIHATPVPLLNAQGLPTYQHVSAEGYYDNHQFLLDNQTLNNQVGYDVLTPFRLDNGETILINRGFVPATADRKILIDITPPRIHTQLTGLLTIPSKNFILGAAIEPQTDKNFWPVTIMRIEPDHLTTLLKQPLSPYVILLDADQKNGFERNWHAPNLWAEKSLGYCFQWAAFALTLLIIYIALNLKKKKTLC